MRSGCFQADTTGKLRMRSSGLGFRVAPAVPDASSPSFSRVNRPGRLPLSVRMNNSGGEQLHITNSDARFFADAFTDLFIEGAESGDWYCVEIYESRQEGIIPAASKAVVPVELAPAGTAVPAVDPTAFTDGYPLRPGMKAITSYFAGTLQAATLWVRTTGGVWKSLADVVDPSAAGALAYDSRSIAVPGDRFYWRGAAAAMTVTIEAQMEVG